MVATSFIVQLAFLPCLVLGSSLSPRAKEFDYNSLTLREVGARNTLNWRVWLEKDGQPISFWHDIPLYPQKGNNRIVSYVVEIPRWTDGKIPVAMRASGLSSLNYTSMEQLRRLIPDPILTTMTLDTLSPDHVSLDTLVNDPIDLSMTDVGQVNWKVLGIDTKDPLAALNDYRLTCLKGGETDWKVIGIAKTLYNWSTANYLEKYYQVASQDLLQLVVSGPYQNTNSMASTIKSCRGDRLEIVGGKVDYQNAKFMAKTIKSYKSHGDWQDARAKVDIPMRSIIQPAAERPAKSYKSYVKSKDYKKFDIPAN
ncbi:hypothetical protein CEK25_008186 [Fusarium fujikuroi]|nr:hypothetical protein CEK25_008186 [Fusarium fujikuroi]